MNTSAIVKSSPWNSWLRLSRVSNLPTVWTNTGTAFMLSTSSPRTLAPVVLVMLMTLTSVCYVAGMILNDAFDAEFDAKFRPNRPIPRGEIAQRTAVTVGFGLLGLGVIGMTLIGWQQATAVPALVSSLALCTTIVVYDAYHKNNPASPILMGFCRGLVFVSVALTLGGLGTSVLVAAGLQIAYVVGLTYAAKQEDLAAPGSWWPLGLLVAAVGYWLVVAIRGGVDERWPLVTATLCGYLMWLWHATRPLFESPRQIGEGVGRMIAGIAALDALLLSMTGSIGATALAAGALLLTRGLHRWVPGT